MKLIKHHFSKLSVIFTAHSRWKLVGFFYSEAYDVIK